MLNRVVLMGRLTADPVLRHTQTNTAVSTFTLAVNRSFAAKDGTREADFFDIVCWRNTAEFVSKYFNKGDMIIIEGSIRVDNYTDKDGNKRKDTKVIINNTQFCGSQRNSTQTLNIEADSEQPSEDDLPF